MPNKNPFIAEKIIISQDSTDFGIFMADGTSVVDSSGNIDAPVTSTNLTLSGTLAVTGASTLTGAVALNGATTASAAVTVGVDDTGYDVTLFGATSGKKTLWDQSADALILRGNLFVDQVAPTAETGAATIAAADLITGIVTITQSTGSTVALTLDTGTAMDTALAEADTVNDSFDWYIINLSAALADTATVTAAAGHTIVGEPIVESAHADSEFQSSAHFRSRRTATNTWVTYRLS